MRSGYSILVVVPARGGSKGVPLKNLRQVGELSLVARVGRVVGELGYVDRAVVSTDHEEIAAEAKQSGLDAPFYRPARLSGDSIGDWDVLVHALDFIEDFDDRVYDVIVMLQPTSPLRRPGQVTAVVDRLIEEDFDAVWTVSETDLKYHPLKQLTISTSGDMNYYDSKGAGITARQQLEPVYHRNGIAYAMSRNCLKDQQTIKGDKTGAVVITEEVVNIDTESDLEQAARLLNSR